MLENEREAYEKFFKAFGLQLKFGLYQSYGMNKDLLQDLLLFYSVKQDKFVTLKEYLSLMSENQKYIYYASGKTIDSIKLSPQLDKVLSQGYDVICLTEDVDEFTLKCIQEYGEKQFRNVAGGDLGIEEEQNNETYQELSSFIKEKLGDKVEKVRISNRIKNHAVCFTVEGEISLEMEKVLNSMPSSNNAIKAKKVLQLNSESSICKAMNSLYENNADDENLSKMINAVYNLACIIEGIQVDNPTEFADQVCELICK